MRTPTRTPLAALAAALTLAASGCGGEDAPEVYALEPTRTCLEESGVQVRTDDLDFVASTALAGALHGELGGNEVTVAFGETAEEGERIESAYRAFAGERIPIDHVLLREENAVVLFAAPPSEDDRSRVVDCLQD